MASARAWPAGSASLATTAAAAATRAQVQDPIGALGLRFSKGEASEETYNRLVAACEAKLKELGG